MTNNKETLAALPSTCNVIIPSPDNNIHDVIPRWTDTGLSLPYAAVTPNSVSDILATMHFATSHGLKIIPAVGGHASFLPVSSKTIYLNLTSPAFKQIVLDEEKGEVKIGGGVLTGDLIKHLAETGWYTTTPNSDAVGMAGALLGGLSAAVNGLHGFGIDQIRSIDVIPFSNSRSSEDAAVLTLTTASTGEEKALFNVLRGAGHGLGIITSVTLSAFRIGNLKMTDNKIWTRRLMFPSSEIKTAARLYTSLLPPPPALAPVLVFVRAPPSAPVPGAPIIMLALSYLGPKEKAEEVCEATYKEEITGKAMVIDGSSKWEMMNMSSAPMNAHGGYKESYAGFCKEVGEESIEKAFEAWETYSSGEGRGRSYTVFSAWDTTQSLDNVKHGGAEFFPARDRGVFVQCTPWYYDPSGKVDADNVGKAVVDATREKDREAGRRDWAFANNLVIGEGMEGIYSVEQIEEIKRVRGVWDKYALGWAPSDGW